MNPRPPISGLGLAASLLLATPAFATHVTVNPDGTGDFATMQAAVNAMVGFPPPAETLLVAAGYYDETVNFSNSWPGVIHAPAGPEVTILRATTSLPERPRGIGSFGARIVGLQIKQHLEWGNNIGITKWQNCIFAGGMTTNVDAPDAANLTKISGCTFRAASTLSRCIFELTDCTFESAPVIASNTGSYLMFLRCRFTGPVDRLIRVTPQSNSEIVFESCRFENAGDAIEISPTRYNQQNVQVRRCVFAGLTGAALRYEYADPMGSKNGYLGVEFTDCRVSNVGQAFRCLTGIQMHLTIQRDTIDATLGPAVEANIRFGSVQGLRITNAQGGGMRFINQSYLVPQDYPHPNQWSIEDCRVSRTGGTGIEVVQMPWPTFDPQVMGIRNSVVEQSAGDGIHFEGPRPEVTGCLLRDNGGDGIHALPIGDVRACALANNTAVGNDGHGIVVDAAAMISPLDAHHNLTTNSGQDGLAVLASYTGNASFNDSWANSGAAYSGLNGGETNLELDPIYCMASAGDFALRADSPCSPSGIYGLIGALGVGCTATTAVPPSAGTTVGLRIAPNPTRGPVAFAWGAGVRPDELVIFDLAGRKLWSASGSSLLSGALRWDARDTDGRAVPAGIYLARWRAGGVTGTARVVLLDR